MPSHNLGAGLPGNTQNESPKDKFMERNLARKLFFGRSKFFLRDKYFEIV